MVRELHAGVVGVGGYWLGWAGGSLVPSSLFGFPTREGGRKKSLVHIDCACAGFTANRSLGGK